MMSGQILHSVIRSMSVSNCKEDQENRQTNPSGGATGKYKHDVGFYLTLSMSLHLKHQYQKLLTSRQSQKRAKLRENAAESRGSADLQSTGSADLLFFFFFQMGKASEASWGAGPPL